MADRIYVTLGPTLPRKRVFRLRSGSPLLRPRDADALRAELRRVAEESGMPLTFGGEVHDDTLLLTEFFGARTGGMRGLAVLPSAGLGGATVVARRPMSVADYRRASSITHDYDGPVLQEGIKSILAVPVVVEGRARAGRPAGRSVKSMRSCAGWPRTRRHRRRCGPSCGCSPNGWRGADRVGPLRRCRHASSTSSPRLHSAARMPKRRNVFR
jgi:hypothetical protein